MTDDADHPKATNDAPVKAGASDKGDAKARADRSNARWVAAGAAMGIGSAALVAALLYTNRDRKDAKSAPKPPKHAPESD